MNEQAIPYVLSLIIAAVLLLAIALHTWSRRPAAGAAPLTLLMLGAAAHALPYALQLGSTELRSALLWYKASFPGAVVLAPAWLIFALQYTGREKWLTRRNLVLLSIVPLITPLLAWTNEHHGFYGGDFRLQAGDPFLVLNWSRGAGFWIHFVFAYLATLSGTIFLIGSTLKAPHLYRRQMTWLFIGALAPVAANLIFISGTSPVPELDLSPFALTITGLAWGFGLYRFKLLDIMPVARDTIFHNMAEGVIVLDTKGRAVDLNPAAGHVLGISLSAAIGRPINQILDIDSDLIACCQDGTEVQTDFRLGAGEAQRDYDLRISPAHDQRGRLVAYLLALRDITDRVRAEEALKRAHDELDLRVRQRTADLTATNEQLQREIAERKRVEEALRESESRYRGLFQDVPISLWEEDFSAIKTYIDELQTQGITDLRAHFENNPQAAVHCATLARIENVNNATLRLFGAKDKEEFFGSLDRILGPESYAVFAEEILALAAGQHLVSTEIINRTLSGDKIHVNLRLSLAPGEENTWSRVLVSLADTTEWVRAEEERERLLAQNQETAQRMQQIMNTVPEGVLVLNPEKRIVLANPVAERDLSTLADAKVGDNLTHLGDRPLTELLTSPPKGLWHKVSTDNQRFRVIARSLEMDPTPGGWVLVIRDVTKEREIESRIQQQERLAAVGQLAAGIAHDFNNIMAVIVLFTRSALRSIPDLSPANHDRLTTVTQQAKRASELIQQILDFSRSSVIERQPLRLLPLLKEQIKLLERTLPETIKINLNSTSDVGGHAAPFLISADPTRIQQMVINLALNARDAMPQGGQLHIQLDQFQLRPGEVPPVPGLQAGEWVQLTVADTGNGIPPDALPRVFDPFFTTKAPGQGTGLGLAQVYGIVKQHEGEVDIKSQLAQGTTFTIYLPALTVHQPNATAKATKPLAQGAGETILVVEDDAITREALVDTLESLAYRTLSGANGLQALKILEQRAHEIQAVLSDVVMPDMGGIALFYTLRQEYPGLPVILLTGHPMEKEMQGLHAQGLTAWFTKPPDLGQLTRVLADAVALRTE